MKLTLRIGILAAAAFVASMLIWQGVAAQGAPDWKLGIARQNVTSQNAINIVTVRNRVGAGDIRLSDLITAVRGAFPSITIFHCSFCRSSMNFDAGLSQKANMGAEHIV